MHASTKNFILAAGLLAGTIIGAGIFSLPFVFRTIGMVPGIIFLLLFMGVYFVIHVMYAEVVELGHGEHQFIYFAERFLPRPLGTIASAVIFGELMFVLVVYLILIPSFVELVVPGAGFLGLIIFWALGSLFMFARLSWLGIAEFLDVVAFVIVIIFIYLASGTRVFSTSFFQPVTLASFFLPFGPLLFSLSGRPAIAKVVEEHRKSRAHGRAFSLTKAIFWGTAIPAFVYLIFVVGVLKLNPGVSSDAISDLGVMSPGFLVLVGLLGLVTLWTSYFMIGINVKDILHEDLKLSKVASAIITIGTPLALYLLGIRNFFSVVTFTGSVFLALEGIFVIAMWRRAFPGHIWRRWGAVLYVIFAAALAYEIFHFFL